MSRSATHPNMHVLILGTDYAPDQIGIAPFNTGLATHLASHGSRVTVVTSFPHYPGYRWRGPVSWLSIETLDTVEVRRVRAILPRRQTALWRVLWDSSFAVAAAAGTIGVRRPDLLVCVSPPIQAGLAAGLLARLWRIPMILWLQDLPLEAAMSVGMLGDESVAVRFGRVLEETAYRMADRIVVIDESFCARLADRVSPSEKLIVIPNWGGGDVGWRDQEIRRQMGADQSDFLVVHTGNMGAKQGLSSVLDAARMANGSSAFKLALVGDGRQRQSLEERISLERIANVRMLPLQPAETLPDLLASADALLLNQRAALTDGVSPSKLITYMAAGRPVIAAAHPNSPAARLVHKAGCGIVVRPEDPSALAAAIQAMQDNSHRNEMGEAGRRYYRAHFDRDTVLKRWEQLLTNPRTTH
jgi:putative colanic acid biosynthesis glycosyltransferase WcaI